MVLFHCNVPVGLASGREKGEKFCVTLWIGNSCLVAELGWCISFDSGEKENIMKGIKTKEVFSLLSKFVSLN